MTPEAALSSFAAAIAGGLATGFLFVVVSLFYGRR